MNTLYQPDWFTQLKDVLPLSKTLVIHGNVKDAIYFGGQYCPLSLFLNSFLQERGYEIIGHYDILDGLEFYKEEHLTQYNQMVESIEIGPDTSSQGYQIPGETNDAFSDTPNSGSSNNQIFTTYSANSKDFFETFSRVRSVFNLKACPPAVFIIYHSDQLVGSSQQMDFSERTNLILLMKIMAAAKNVRGLPQLLIIVADEIRKIPPALYFENPRCRQIFIPLPAIDERKEFINKFYNVFYHSDPSGAKDADIENLAVCTEGLTHYDLQNLSLVSSINKICVSEAKKLVKRYKFGQKQSPWDSLSREKLLATPWARLKRDDSGMPLKGDDGRYVNEKVSLNLKDCLRERVIGQDHAVDAVETMLIRAVEGIHSTKSSESFTKPKGIFLFAGPTGVGKTELTKALTEWLFGDENSMLRFDMSEYNQEHSDQKLIGAPPGYVGHEQGGQLTNSVRKKPFCVILFDEMDKMHPKIWDIFLQLLDDGRLTDGTGETVYFSETVIIMTSNLGGAEHPQGEQNSRKIRAHYLNAVNLFFRTTLKRPEILNRIGMDNVIAFNSIEKDFQEKIIWQKLNALNQTYMEKIGFNLEFDSSVIKYLLEDPQGFARNGARGAENLIATHIINPLSRYLFYNPDAKEDPKPLSVKIFSGNTTETVFDRA